MEKTVVVGDIHGDVEKVEKILSINLPIVFVGDLLDSFNRSIDDQITCAKLIYDAAQVKDSRVQVLYGNHDFQYLHPEHCKCSGYKALTQMRVDVELRSQLMTVPKSHVWVGKWLVTHAGLTAQWLRNLGYQLGMIDTEPYYVQDIEEKLSRKMDEDVMDPTSWFHQVSSANGGHYSLDGPLWARPLPGFGFKPIPFIPQVFGHTSMSQGRFWEAHNYVCIDVLQKSDLVAIIEDDLLTPATIGELIR